MARRRKVKTIRAGLEDSNNVGDQKNGKRSTNSPRTTDFVEKLQKKVDDDPTKSCMKPAMEMGVNRYTISTKKCEQRTIFALF